VARLDVVSPARSRCLYARSDHHSRECAVAFPEQILAELPQLLEYILQWSSPTCRPTSVCVRLADFTDFGLRLPSEPSGLRSEPVHGVDLAQAVGEKKKCQAEVKGQPSCGVCCAAVCFCMDMPPPHGQ